MSAITEFVRSAQSRRNVIDCSSWQNNRRAWIACFAIIVLMVFVSSVFAQNPPLIATVSSNYADMYMSLNLRSVQCRQWMKVDELLQQIEQVESWCDVEIDDVNNDGCYDDFLLLTRSLAGTMDKLEWYKLVDSNMVYQGTILESVVQVDELLAFSSGDLDGDIYLDFLIVERPAVLGDDAPPSSTWLGYYEFDPCSGHLESKGKIDLPMESQRYDLVTLDIGDWQDDGEIDIITVEQDQFIDANDPNDDLMRVRRYHFNDNDGNDPNLSFEEELVVAQRWLHCFKDIEIGRLDDPNDFEAFVMVDGILYESSTTIEQWRRIEGEMTLTDFPLITIPQAERLIGVSIIPDGNACEEVYGEYGQYPNGDIDEDCVTSFLDFAALGGQWDSDMCGPLNDWCGGADFDKNGSVEFLDLAVIAEGWLMCTDTGLDCGHGVYFCGGEDEYEHLPGLVGMLQYWFGAEPPDVNTLWFEEWECSTQCHGNADCALEGSPFAGYYCVGDIDLSILVAAMGTSYPDPNYDPSADFTRDGNVDQNDYYELNLWFKVKEPPHGPGVPDDCPTAP